MVHWQGKAENPLFPGRAGLGMLKHVTVLLAPLLCAKTWLIFLFGENGNDTQLQERECDILWCHLEPEILHGSATPAQHPPSLSASLQLRCFLPAQSCFSQHTSQTRSASSDALPAKASRGSDTQGSAPCGGSPKAAKSSWAKAPHLCYTGN